MKARTSFGVTLLLLLSSAAIALAEPLLLDSQTIEPTTTNGESLSELLLAAPGAGGRHVLVQLTRIPNAGERGELAARGLALLHYIPNRGYLASVEQGAAEDPVIGEWVGWSAPIPLADKTSEEIRLGITPPYAVLADGRLALVIYTFSDVSESAARLALSEAGAEILQFLPEFDRYEAHVPPARLTEVIALDEVRWVRCVSPPPVDDVDGARYNHKVDEIQAAPYNLSGVNVDIGQCDSGNPDMTHDDLQGRITRVQVLGTSDHATHVAGIAMGDGTLSEACGGTALQWRGMATAAEIYSWGSGGNYLAPYNIAINTYDIELATNSWGWLVSSTQGNCYLYGNYSNGAPEHDQIITGLHGKRISIFFSAGNERTDCDCGMSCTSPYINYTCIRPPGATSKNTITVGSKPSNRGDVSDFSSWGPMDDGRLKPEIVASGDELFPSPDAGITAPVPGDTYGVKSGTSMSTPVGAGCAALFIEDFRALTAQDPAPATIKAHFVHTASDLDNDTIVYLTPGPDFASGYGVLKMNNCIDQLRTGNWVEDSLDNGESDFYSLYVPGDATEVKITLAWDDEAGAQNANPALVNDLDLVVTDPDATRHYPWTLDPGNPGDPAVRTQEDHINPLEQVFVDDALVEGQWTIEVRGTTVPDGPQPYSLVFSHDGTTGTAAPEIAGSETLRAVTLYPSHPNPFRPWTSIAYSLSSTRDVELRVLDIRGRVVRTLVASERQSAGDYTYTWRGRNDAGRDVASGVYLVELRAGQERLTTKVSLVR
jgi:hypothetical protein